MNANSWWPHIHRDTAPSVNCSECFCLIRVGDGYWIESINVDREEPEPMEYCAECGTKKMALTD